MRKKNETEQFIFDERTIFFVVRNSQRRWVRWVCRGREIVNILFIYITQLTHPLASNRCSTKPHGNASLLFLLCSHNFHFLFCFLTLSLSLSLVLFEHVPEFIIRFSGVVYLWMNWLCLNRFSAFFSYWNNYWFVMRASLLGHFYKW